jgi:2-polyprenyl-3-methyl-5-hydroxy-6-metoxy-1,4-benzoquinol methylase
LDEGSKDIRFALRRIFNRYFCIRRWQEISTYLTGDVLDVGCGPGGLYRYAKKKNIKSYLGVDIVDERTVKNFEFVAIDLDTQARYQIKGPFDTVVLSACIEHLTQPNEVLIWSKGILRAEGHLVLTTPSPFGQNVLKKIFGGGTEHTKIYDKKGIYQELKLAGFEVMRFKNFEFGANQLVVAKPNNF